MTETEAVQGAKDRHELRGLLNEIHGGSRWWMWLCWCAAKSEWYDTEASARAAHGRHQDRDVMLEKLHREVTE